VQSVLENCTILDSYPWLNARFQNCAAEDSRPRACAAPAVSSKHYLIRCWVDRALSLCACKSCRWAMLAGALRAGARACGRTVGWHARVARRPAVAAAAAAGTAAAAGIAFWGTPTTRCEAASVVGQLASILTRLDRVDSALDKKNSLVIRPGRPEDSEVILGMIHDLAILEKELDQVKMTEATLRRDGWPTASERAAGAQPRFETFIAEVDGDAVGFALYFHIYSTWEGLRCGSPIHFSNVTCAAQWVC
jgi:hypothetical protein